MQAQQQQQPQQRGPPNRDDMKMGWLEKRTGEGSSLASLPVNSWKWQRRYWVQGAGRLWLCPWMLLGLLTGITSAIEGVQGPLWQPLFSLWAVCKGRGARKKGVAFAEPSGAGKWRRGARACRESTQLLAPCACSSPAVVHAAVGRAPNRVCVAQHLVVQCIWKGALQGSPAAAGTLFWPRNRGTCTTSSRPTR